MVKPTGFREYDARWLFEKEINLMGVQALGLGLARLLRELGVRREVVVGHDFRSYSGSIKLALTAGLMAGGAKVRDIGSRSRRWPTSPSSHWIRRRWRW
jgi:phosphomannomutase/phosphoglucomutase